MKLTLLLCFVHGAFTQASSNPRLPVVSDGNLHTKDLLLSAPERDYYGDDDTYYGGRKYSVFAPPTDDSMEVFHEGIMAEEDNMNVDMTTNDPLYDIPDLAVEDIATSEAGEFQTPPVMEQSLVKAFGCFRKTVVNRFPTVKSWSQKEVGFLFGVKLFVEKTLQVCITPAKLLTHRERFIYTFLNYHPSTNMKNLQLWFDEILLNEDWLGEFLYSLDACEGSAAGKPEKRGSPRRKVSPHKHFDSKAVFATKAKKRNLDYPTFYYPIVRFKELVSTLAKRIQDISRKRDGLFQIVAGMSRKANRDYEPHHHGDNKWSTHAHSHDGTPPSPSHADYHSPSLEEVKPKDKIVSYNYDYKYDRYSSGRKRLSHQGHKDDSWARLNEKEKKHNYKKVQEMIFKKALKYFITKKLMEDDFSMANFANYTEEFVVGALQKFDNLALNKTKLADWFDDIILTDWFPDFLDKIVDDLEEDVSDRDQRGSVLDKVDAIEQIMELAERAGLDRKHHMTGDMNICLCL